MERAASQTWRIAVLSSGHSRGSNLRALQSYFQQQSLPVEIAFVTASTPAAPVCQVCAELGLPCKILRTKSMPDFELRLAELLRQEKIDLIALAGFLRLLSAQFITAAGVPILNIHPALLPAHGGEGLYGMRVHQAVFAAGDELSGATVHLLDPLYDHGPILAQQSVSVADCASAEEIAARVLKIEHQLYAPAIHSFLSRKP